MMTPFPKTTKANASDYTAISDGKRKMSLDKYNLGYEYGGKKVSNPINVSTSGGASKSFALQYSSSTVSPDYDRKMVELKWRTDYDAIEWAIFLDDGRDEIIDQMAYALQNLFDTNDQTRDYSD